MSWIDRIVGGTVEFEGQGPLWKTLGAKLGVGPDGDQDDALVPHASQSAVRLTAVRSRLGTTVTGVLAKAVDKPATALITLQQRGHTLRAEPPFSNEHGHFWMTVPVWRSALAFHLPFGALHYDREEPTVMLQLALTADGAMMLSELFMVRLPTSPVKWDPVALFEPLIRLCVGVAQADGQLVDDEIQRIELTFGRQLGLGAHALPRLRQVIGEGPPEYLEDALADLCLRFPGLQPTEVLELLAGVAFADGEIHPMEQRFISDIAGALGVPTAIWPRLASELGIGEIASERT